MSFNFDRISLVQLGVRVAKYINIDEKIQNQIPKLFVSGI